MDASLNSELPSPELPGGTVTFLFTDIEVSTRLPHQLDDRYAKLLADPGRIRSIGLRGEALLSEIPAALVRDDLPGG